MRSPWPESHLRARRLRWLAIGLLDDEMRQYRPGSARLALRCYQKSVISALTDILLLLVYGDRP